MSKAPRLVLNDPTPLMIAVADFKGFTYETTEIREALPGIFGPSLTFGPEIAVGEAGALGWMDRRHPYPALFPYDTRQYASVATISHALIHNQIEPDQVFTARDTNRSFLFGNSPTLADVLLAIRLSEQKVNESASEFINDVFSFCGPQDLAGV